MYAWDEFLKFQERQLGIETVQKWLTPLKVIHFDACNLYLEAQDAFQVLWFEEHIRAQVVEKLFNNNHHQIKVHLSLNEENSGPVPSKKKKKGFTPLPSPPQITSDPLDPWHTLQNFLCIPANEVPYKLSCELVGYDIDTHHYLKVEKKPAFFTPTYFYGNAGSGKTHLLSSLASAFSAAGYTTLYVKAESFTEHVISAIRSGSMQSFRKAYRNVDVLLIEDVHLFAKKAATQEEFFHTFNTLHTEGKQIILSANMAPHLLSGIEPRLMSRFEWGITLKLEKLPRNMFAQWLKKRSIHQNFAISEEIENYLLEHFSQNVKSLAKALDTLLFQCQLRNKHSFKNEAPFSDLSLAKHFLTKFIEEERKNALTPQKIVRIIADFYGLRIEDILGKSQSHDCSMPRQLAMHLCRQELKMPFLKIGSFFSRDHSTVMASVKQVLKKIEGQEKEISSASAEILRRIHANYD